MGSCQSDATNQKYAAECRRAADLERELDAAKRDAEDRDRQIRLENALRRAAEENVRKNPGEGTRNVQQQVQVKRTLEVHRRRQIMVIAIDVSGSMAGNRIRDTIAGVKKMISGLCANDHFTIVIFNDSVRQFTAGFVDATPENIRSTQMKLDTINVGGQTAFYDAVMGCTNAILGISEKVKEANKMMRTLESLRDAAGMNGGMETDLGHCWLVMVTDGADNKSKASLRDCATILHLLARCGVQYSTLWLGVNLSGDAERAVRTLDAVGGKNSQFLNITDGNLSGKFQEVAMKMKTKIQI